jgi:hypothetical protein
MDPHPGMLSPLIILWAIRRRNGTGRGHALLNADFRGRKLVNPRTDVLDIS